MAHLEGFQPPTQKLEISCSMQLSYRCIKLAGKTRLELAWNFLDREVIRLFILLPILKLVAGVRFCTLRHTPYESVAGSTPASSRNY